MKILNKPAHLYVRPKVKVGWGDKVQCFCERLDHSHLYDLGDSIRNVVWLCS